MSGEDDAEKEHEPSQKRLDDARARGEIARSPDLVTACGYAGLLLGAAAFGIQSVTTIGNVGAAMLDQADKLAPLMMHGGAAPVAGLMAPLLGATIPFLVVPGMIALAYLIASKSLIFSPEKLSPKLSRISPLSNACCATAMEASVSTLSLKLRN